MFKPATEKPRYFAPLFLFALVFVGGCAGFRGGWMSIAYLGDSPPAVPVEPLSGPALHQRPTLRVPGLELQVELDNEMRTYDNQVVLFVVPTSVDPRKTYSKNVAPGKTRVFVTVTAAEAGFVFRPGLAELGIGTQRHTGIAGFDFGQWNAAGERVAQGGTWEHRAIGEEFVLAEPGRRYHLSIDFATPTPSPESPDIRIDLSRALASPRQPPLPVIRFAPRRWKQGYT